MPRAQRMPQRPLSLVRVGVASRLERRGHGSARRAQRLADRSADEAMIDG